MKLDFLGVAIFGGILLIGLTVIICFIGVGILIMKALIKYIKSGDVKKEKSIIRKSLGEVLKQHRTDRNMTQEFVAEAIGVSRQAIAKWELAFSKLKDIKNFPYNLLIKYTLLSRIEILLIFSISTFSVSKPNATSPYTAICFYDKYWTYCIKHVIIDSFIHN